MNDYPQSISQKYCYVYKNVRSHGTTKIKRKCMAQQTLKTATWHKPSKQMQKKISNNFKNIIAKEYNK